LLEIDDAAIINGAYVVFDLAGNQIGDPGGSFGRGWTQTNATITDVGNGWRRCMLTVTSGGTTIGAQIRADASAGTAAQVYSYAGGGAGSGCAFDRTTSGSGSAGRLWMAFGYGMGYFDFPSKTAAFNTFIPINIRQKGIESTDGNFVMSMPGYSSPIVAVDDQQVFQITDPTNTPPFNCPSIRSRSKNSSTWSCDFFSKHPAAPGDSCKN
jgi:hypothetical protein